MAAPDAARVRRRWKFWKWLLWSIAGLVALLAILIAGVALSPSFRDWAATRLLTDSIVRDRLADVPARTHAQPVQHAMVRMRDGLELSTQVFLPEGAGPWPVVVVRDPYSLGQYLTC